MPRTPTRGYAPGPGPRGPVQNPTSFMPGNGAPAPAPVNALAVAHGQAVRPAGAAMGPNAGMRGPSAVPGLDMLAQFHAPGGGVPRQLTAGRNARAARTDPAVGPHRQQRVKRYPIERLFREPVRYRSEYSSEDAKSPIHKYRHLSPRQIRQKWAEDPEFADRWYVDYAESVLRERLKLGQATGLDRAASNLQHFLDGSGQKITYTRAEIREDSDFEQLVGGLETDAQRTIETLINTPRPDAPIYEYIGHLGKLRDGEQISLPKVPTDSLAWPVHPDLALPIDPDLAMPPDPDLDQPFPHDLQVPADYWEAARTTAGNAVRGNIDEALASGSSAIRSEAIHGFTAKRTGDRVRMEGLIQHTWRDRYDFEEGGLAAHFPMVVEEAGRAKRFLQESTWQQKLVIDWDVEDGKLVNPRYLWMDIDPEKGAPASPEEIPRGSTYRGRPGS